MKKSPILQTVDAICISMLIVLVILALLQVMFRYVLKISVPWTEEVARMVYSYLIFTGLILVEGENGHMKTTYFINKFPVKIRFIVQVVINLMSIMFCSGLIYGAIKMIRSSWIFKMGSLPSVSSAIVYIPIIVGMPFVIYYLIKQLIHYKEYFLETNE
jgi:TRAP-type C4-dicarboxylate transport system permease small subunit